MLFYLLMFLLRRNCQKLAKWWISSYLQVTLAIFKAGLYQNRNKYWIISTQKHRSYSKQNITHRKSCSKFRVKNISEVFINDIFSGKLADRQVVQCHANHHILTIIKELFSVDGFCFFPFLQLFQHWLSNSLSSSTWTDSNIQKDQLFTSPFAIYLFLSGKCTTRFLSFSAIMIIHTKINLFDRKNDQKGLKHVFK